MHLQQSPYVNYLQTDNFKKTVVALSTESGLEAFHDVEGEPNVRIMHPRGSTQQPFAQVITARRLLRWGSTALGLVRLGSRSVSGGLSGPAGI
jgi:hypothetical protein